MYFKLTFFVLLALLVLLFVPSNRAAEFDYDLGIRPEDVTFSSSPLVIGQKVRVYATVYNFGVKDMLGYVSFFQGPELIGDSQVISVRANGFADEVFIDFIVPSGSFNILAAIRGTSPQDQNPANDEALTQLFTPVLDSDGDGVPDASDNCQSMPNTDQKNSDGDALGDACDPDNDNDGLSDIDERRGGTNPFNPDTDNDGLSDSKDPAPLKPNAPVAEEKPAKAPAKSLPVVEDKKQNEAAPIVADALLNKGDAAKDSKFSLPLKITDATFEKQSWKSFAFMAEAMGGTGDYEWHWEFGDSQSALGKNVFHEYKKPGDYKVKLSVKDGAKNEVTAEFPISVSFFNFANPKFWIALGLLAAAAGSLIFISWKPARGGKNYDNV